MKKLIFIFLTLITMSSCNYVAIKGDEEVVVVQQPYIFGSGGVVDEPVSSGSFWKAWSSSIITFKITPQTVEEHFDDLITDDNNAVDFSAYFKYQIRKGTTPEIYKKFGENWYSQSVKETFRAIVRDKCSQYKMFDLAANRNILAEIEQNIHDKMNSHFKEWGMTIDILQITIGKVKPPQEVLNETNKTAAQVQSKLTQAARKNAEDSRKDAEESKAIADKAYQVKMGMTTDEYLKLRALELEKEKIEMVKGNKNVTVIFSSGTDVQPITTVK